MSNKTCGECKHFSCSDEGRCMDDEWTYCDSDACNKFQSKVVTNGDVIRKMSNAELARLDKCHCCMYFGGEFCEGVVCEKPNGKTCVDGREAWLNAPAESEGEDE